VIEDTHGKNRIECPLRRQVLKGQRQDGDIGYQGEALQGMELQDGERQGIDPRHLGGVRCGHAKDVIPATAAYVEDAPPGKGFDLRAEPVPLHVRTPLRLDADPKDLERTLALSISRPKG